MNRFLINVFFLIACNQLLPDLHYKSTDDVAGGFNDFNLELNSNGLLKLTIETSVLIDQNEAGSIWESFNKTLTGSWSKKNEAITYSFNEKKTSIDSIFINTVLYDFTTNPIITFSVKLDTAFIYGIPCKIVDDK